MKADDIDRVLIYIASITDRIYSSCILAVYCISEHGHRRKHDKSILNRKLKNLWGVYRAVSRDLIAFFQILVEKEKKIM